MGLILFYLFLGGRGVKTFFLKWQVEMENQKNEGWRWMTKKWGDGDGRPKNGGEETDDRKMGGWVEMRGRSPRETKHTLPQGVFSIFP